MHVLAIEFRQSVSSPSLQHTAAVASELSTRLPSSGRLLREAVVALVKPSGLWSTRLLLERRSTRLPSSGRLLRETVVAFLKASGFWSIRLLLERRCAAVPLRTRPFVKSSGLWSTCLSTRLPSSGRLLREAVVAFVKASGLWSIRLLLERRCAAVPLGTRPFVKSSGLWSTRRLLERRCAAVPLGTRPSSCRRARASPLKTPVCLLSTRLPSSGRLRRTAINARVKRPAFSPLGVLFQ